MSVPKLRFKEFSGEWEEKRLGDIAKVGRGKSKHRPRNDKILFGGKYPFVQTGDIKKAKLYLTNFTQTYSEEGLKQSKLWKKGTLCITIAANIAENTILGIDACFPDSIIGIECLPDKVITLYLKNYLDFLKREFEKLAEGLAQDNLNLEKLFSLIFKLPILEEQEEISSFLSSVDTKIEKIEKKVELLKQYKKGMMQKIFSQEIRFKDENGNDYPDWVEKELGDIAQFSKGKGISKENISVEGLECIRYGELYTVYSEKIEKIFSKTSLLKEDLIFSEKNDILIPSSGEVAIDLATALCVLKKGIAIGGDINIIKSEENGLFLSYYLNNKKKNEISKLGQGSSVVHLYNKQLKKLKLIIPNILEQEKIANLLSSLDKKIEIVEKELAQIKEFKKGLLQQMFV